MTREIAHSQMFTAALDSIQPNFPPGILQGDPHFTHEYDNMSNGASARGPWNQGQGPWGPGQSWDYADDPIQHVVQTQGQLQHPQQGTQATPEQVEQQDRTLGQQRSTEIKGAVPGAQNQWSAYPQKELASPSGGKVTGQSGGTP